MPFRPLVELHSHFDGLTKSSGIRSMLDIADDEGIVLPAKDEKGLFKALRCGTIRESLGHYLEAFQWTTAVMQSKEALRRLAFEHMREWAGDGVLYGELRFMPTLHCQRGLLAAEAVEATLDGLRAGASAFGVDYGLILCSMRHINPLETELIMHLAEKYRGPGVVAVDLAGNDNMPALELASAYAWARRRHIGVTIHAAEGGPAIRAREALDLFKAQRFGHGITIGQDPALLAETIRLGIPYEVCPTSNVQISMVSSYEEHPAREYFRAGAKVTINVDNRMLAWRTLNEEFAEVERAWGLDAVQKRQLVENAIRASWAPAHVKHELLLQLDA